MNNSYDTAIQLLEQNTAHTPSAVTGHLVWVLLHDRCFSFPHNASPKMKAAMYVFVKDIIPILFDCKVCQVHYIAQFEQTPAPLENMSRTTLSEWSVRVHNAVNIRIGHPQMNIIQAYAEHVRRQQAVGGIRIQYRTGTWLNDNRDFVYGMGTMLLIAGVMVMAYSMYTTRKNKMN